MRPSSTNWAKKKKKNVFDLVFVVRPSWHWLQVAHAQPQPHTVIFTPFLRFQCYLEISLSERIYAQNLCFLDHCESMMACTFISCTITHVRFFPSLKTTMHPLQPCKNRAPFLIIHQRNDVTKTYIDEPPIFFLWSSSLPRSRPCQVCVDKVCTPSRNQHANVTHT